eukprot:767166-Hanusia_phi.AAC.3
MHRRHAAKQERRRKKLEEAIQDMHAVSSLLGLQEEDRSPGWPALDASWTTDWESLPSNLDPACAELSEDEKPGRAQRKRKQLEAMTASIMPFLDRLIAERGEQRVRIVEFGSGTGHLGILIAYLRREQTHVTLVERKEYSCRIAEDRVSSLQLDNVQVFCGDIEDFERSQEAFDLGISLHSCGILTDLILDLCCSLHASYVLCPCCYGQCSREENLSRFQRPRSMQFARVMDEERFASILSGADYAIGQGDWNFDECPNFAKAKFCMRIVDADRNLPEEQCCGWAALSFMCMPKECSRPSVTANFTFIATSTLHASSGCGCVREIYKADISCSNVDESQWTV